MTHGKRATYIRRGCRCAPCKEANRLYNIEYRRARPHPNAMVNARRAKRHILKLSKHGVGLRAIRDVTGMSFSHLGEIRRGTCARVRTTTERRLLAITADAHADHATICGARTLRLVMKLRSEGFGYHQLALRLDMCSEALERLVRRKGNVKAVTQMKVQKFYDRIMAA